MFYFTADEHYAHDRIRLYTSRPFATVGEMDEALIANHNAVVGDGDITVHVGDFTLIRNAEMVHKLYVCRLKGKHIFIRGSHDKWMPRNAMILFEQTIDGQVIVACHYAMRVWPRSHYGSWCLYGHSHGRLPPIGKQHDVGVDANGYTPVSFEKIKEIMAKREDNPNLVRKRFESGPAGAFDQEDEEGS